MIRLEIQYFTGNKAENLKVASRLRRKIRGAIHSGHTVLIDFENVREITTDFAVTIIQGIDAKKIKIAGLLPSMKRHLGYPESEGGTL